MKKIARQFLAKLKREKFILYWRLRETAKADVRETIRQEFDQLPDVYERKLWDEKVERTYQFVFEHFATVSGQRLLGRQKGSIEPEQSHGG